MPSFMGLNLGNIPQAFSAAVQALRGSSVNPGDTRRVTRYAELRMNYQGYYTPYDPVTRLPIKNNLGQDLVIPIKYNFNRPIAHLAASFLAKHDLNFQIEGAEPEDGGTAAAQSVVNAVQELWEATEFHSRFREAALVAAVEGECYLKWVPDANGGLPSLKIVSPSLVYPRYDSHDYQSLLSATVLYTIVVDGKEVPYREEHSPGRMEVFIDDKRQDDQTLEWDGDYLLLVRCPNTFYPGSPVPISDIEPSIFLVQDYSWICEKMRRIVDLNAAPNLVFKGTQPAQGQDQSSGQVSKLMTDAYYVGVNGDAKYLEWSGNTQGAKDILELIRADISTVSRTPSIALSDNADTHQLESGVALRILFAPLVDKTLEKRVTWEETIRKALSVAFQITNRELPDGLEIVWTSPVPESEGWLTDVVNSRVQNGTLSRRSAMNLLGVDNPIVELAQAIEDEKAWTEAGATLASAAPLSVERNAKVSGVGGNRG